MAHGPLMVSGFLGTLISLERAVALSRRWPHLAAALSGLGGIALAAGVPGVIGPVLLTLGSLGLVLIFLAILRRHFTGYTLVMAGGAASWLIGNLLWLSGRAIFEIVLWWAAFLILTIAGERLELGRLVRLPHHAELLFLITVGSFFSGLVLSVFELNLGVRLASVAMLSMAAWLLRYDISRRTIRKPGLPRFAAICLLSGYFWLGAAGAIGIMYGAKPAGPIYDAFLHAIFVGYIFSMIFGHAPIIFPAILRLPVTFTTRFYLHLILLHASLLLRIGGDLTGIWTARLWGGLLNGIAILVFLGLTGWSIRKSRIIRQSPAEGISQPESANIG